ncbi:MAG: hypothetical protein JXA06_04120 [Bacteroidetes bacterium]|nr:hypothetical protein [Bacteroidota bacterium]
MKIIILILYTSLLIGFFGCASTNITSFIDPDYKTTNFTRVLIIANLSDLQWRQQIESRLVQEFRDNGIFALEGINLFPPTREFTEQEKIDLLIQNKIDSYILIDVGETGTEQVYIPQTGSSTKTEGSVSVHGKTTTYSEETRTTNYGGYTVSKPWAKFDAKLFDVSNGQNAWIASAFTSGNAYANHNTVINSFCGKTVKQLIKDGVFKKGTYKVEMKKSAK